MRVLVTGGAGFIGSYAVAELLREGHQVGIADRFTYAGKAKNLQAAGALGRVDLLIGDLATGDLAARCAAWSPEGVIHMAAETHVDQAIAHPEAFILSNVLGTTRLLQALADSATLEAMVVYSTDEVFGPWDGVAPYDERQPFAPSNAYSASKVGVEAVTNAFVQTHGLPATILRPCNTYGPRQHPEKAIPRFVTQALRGQKLTIYNDGQGSRDWVYAEDHARATVTLLGRLARGLPCRAAYNLAANASHTDQEIATAVLEVLMGEGWMARQPHDALIQYVAGRPGHDRRYLMNGDALAADTGWAPRMPFWQGLEATVRWNATEQAWWETDAVRWEGPSCAA